MVATGASDLGSRQESGLALPILAMIESDIDPVFYLLTMNTAHVDHS